MKPRIRSAEDWADELAASHPTTGCRAEPGLRIDDTVLMISRIRDEVVTWAVHVALETGGKDAWRAADSIRLRAGEVHW